MTKRQLQNYVELSPVAYAMFDREMRYLAASKRWVEYHGLASQEITGQCHYDIFPSIPDHWKASHRQAMNGESVHSDEDRLETTDGTIKWYRWDMQPWHTKGGVIGGIIIFCEDITQRKQAEDTLRASENRFRMLFENSRDALLIAAPPSWRFTMVNRAAIQLFGIDSSKILTDLSPWHLSPPFQPDGEPSSKKMEKIISIVMRDGSMIFEWEHQQLDGTIFPAEILLTKMEMDSQPFILASVRNISERKHYEMGALKKRKEMGVVHDNQVAIQTAAAFAHELNQPLQAISSYCKGALALMDEKSQNHDQVRFAIEQSEQQALRAGMAIRELLNLLAKNEMKAEKLDPYKEIYDAVAIIRSEQDFQFYLDVGPERVDHPLVLANRTQLQKVIHNLLLNALEAMSSLGIPKPKLTVEIFTNEDGSYVQVTIRDNGPGFEPEGISLLFKPFITNKPSGIGMGLSVSRALIEENGGELWIEPNSERGGGCVHFSLPTAV